MPRKNTIKQFSIVDLFSGVGGLTHGLVKEGFDVRAGVDSDNSCKYAYTTNNKKVKFINKKVEDLTDEELNKHFGKGKRKILVGCAPCQPFSTYTNKKIGDKNQKWKLLYDFAEIIRRTEPEIVSMENVPLLKKFSKQPVFDEFVSALEDMGYFVRDYLVYCPDYGIPQTRTRLVLLASKRGYVDLIPKTHTPETYLTVRDSIGHLPPIKAGEQFSDDPLHRASALSEINLKRIRASKPGGSWTDWDEDLQLVCHSKESGKSYGSVYGRMKWEDPAPTMTTQCIGIGNGRFGHPEQDRGISLREAAIFQTFPEDYQFIDPNDRFYPTFIARHIGNAVPVRLGQIIAKSIKNHIKKYYD